MELLKVYKDYSLLNELEISAIPPESLIGKSDYELYYQGESNEEMVQINDMEENIINKNTKLRLCYKEKEKISSLEIKWNKIPEVVIITITNNQNKKEIIRIEPESDVIKRNKISQKILINNYISEIEIVIDSSDEYKIDNLLLYQSSKSKYSCDPSSLFTHICKFLSYCLEFDELKNDSINALCVFGQISGNSTILLELIEELMKVYIYIYIISSSSFFLFFIIYLFILLYRVVIIYMINANRISKDSVPQSLKILNQSMVLRY